MAQSLEILSSWLEKIKTSKWRQLALYSDLLPQSFEAWGSIPIPDIAVNKKPHNWLRAYLQHARCSRTNVFIETPFLRDERTYIQWTLLFQTLLWNTWVVWFGCIKWYVCLVSYISFFIQRFYLLNSCWWFQSSVETSEMQFSTQIYEQSTSLNHCSVCLSQEVYLCCLQNCKK